MRPKLSALAAHLTLARCLPLYHANYPDAH
ncbi:unnamed protein product [Nippostrongylus brasiliensis]|uniref:Transcriptional regulator n=1 Tax=Nippostrongylus brasiliensis TaxID=27835 RepID=A0A0N4Y454_NIPBR|nr:unnamed protein product [Nippostrongylus brasiliensis]